MTKMIFQDKYPVFTKSLPKGSIKYKNIKEICNFFQDKIDGNEVATFISIFDNFTHTKSINGDINPDIKNAITIIFCFGKAIPNSAILAVRPRSIGVVEYDDRFDICFLEAPNEMLQKTMETWMEDFVK